MMPDDNRGHKVNQCRKCNNSKSKESWHRNKHRDNRKQYAKNKTQKVASAWREFLVRAKGSICLDCNASYPPYVLDFDHVRGEKLFIVSQARGMIKQKVLQEIEKCDIVCSNCHRRRTYNRRTNK